MHTTHSIGYLLQHISTLLGRQSDQVLQEQLGIGLSQFKILRALETCPQLNQRDIANNLGQTEASVSRQIKLMMRLDLLRRVPNPKNKRERIPLLTPKGRRITQASLEILGKYHAPTFAALDEKQQVQLAGILDLLHAQVCNMPHASPVVQKSDKTK